MTKQEEIREGIAKKLCLSDGLDWERLPESGYSNSKDREYYRRLVTSIFQDLHSQGVVIKVEGELPEEPKGSGMREQFEDILSGYRTAQMEMLKAGYVAVEPLIDTEDVVFKPKSTRIIKGKVISRERGKFVTE